MTGIVVEHLGKTFPGRPPVAALHDVSLEVEPASITAVLGPSGCGKTTLLRAIAGFERIDQGRIRFGDTVVATTSASLPPERRHVGIVPQDGALFPHHDVAGNVAFALRGRRRNHAARVAELLDLVGLSGFERRRPHELSGGQQQRVALARALAPEPTVVLLDEPFTALDTTLRSRLRDDVAAVLRQAGATAIIVTHDPVEALAMADRVAVMRDGRIVQVGPSRDVYEQPADATTARLLGDVEIVAGTLSLGQVTCALGILPTRSTRSGGQTCRPSDGPGLVLLRPEQLVLDPAGPLRAHVRAVRFQGADALVDLGVDGTLVTARWSSVVLPAPGDVVGVRVAGPVTVVPAMSPVAEPADGDD